jgi:hypothetical protein
VETQNVSRRSASNALVQGIKFVGHSFHFGKIFLTKNIMTWQVITGYGTSCAWSPQKVVGEVVRMVREVP